LKGGERATGSPADGSPGGSRVRVGASVSTSTLTVALDSVGDAPACDVCGTITVRSGTCYKCMNCGASMGCS
jgi:ribonucleoside-diphosphate reductase alpha chain